LRRTSSLTGTEVHPDSRNCPNVAGRELMAPRYRSVLGTPNMH
jgi:hypothetical protein